MLRSQTAPQVLGALDILAGDQQKQTRFHALIKAVDNDAAGLVRAGIDQGKTSLKARMRKAVTPGHGVETTEAVEDGVHEAVPANEANTAVVQLIDALRDSASDAFLKQRMEPPFQASDAQLVVLLHSWSPAMGHKSAVYKSALQEKISRFKSSASSMIGRYSYYEGAGTGKGNKYDYDQQVNTVVRDTRLVLETFDDETPAKLMYYKRDLSGHQVGHRKHFDETKPWPGIELDEEFKRWKPVEAEFVEVAIANNLRAWGEGIRRARRRQARRGRTDHLRDDDSSPVSSTEPTARRRGLAAD